MYNTHVRKAHMCLCEWYYITYVHFFPYFFSVKFIFHAELDFAVQLSTLRISVLHSVVLYEQSKHV